MNLPERIMLDQSVISNFVTTFGPLFAIANPFGAVPIFLGLVPAQQRRKQALLIGITVLVVLILSLLAGEGIFNFFGINFGVLRIAGGLLIFKIGWQMASVNDSLVESQQRLAQTPDGTNAIVPIAIPLISGPGAISVVISQAHAASEWTAYVGSSIAIILLSIVVWFCLFWSGKISKKLGSTGIEALERIFGFIALAIALEMFSNGLFGVLRNYGPEVIKLLS